MTQAVKPPMAGERKSEKKEDSLIEKFAYTVHSSPSTGWHFRSQTKNWSQTDKHIEKFK